MENNVKDNSQDLNMVIGQVEKFLNDTVDARYLSERDRDYKDHKQWTSEEVSRLTARKQAPIVVNRIKPKVDGLLGLLAMRKTDPKAYPRTKKHEKTAEAITDALRFVADNNDFNDTVKMEVADNVFVEGYGAAIVQVEQVPNGDVEIRIDHIPWDRFYFDSHSRKKDFSDARYMGEVLWLDVDEAKERFPDADIDNLMNENDEDETFEDRPKWVDTKGQRVRLALHFYKKQGKWWMCIFSKKGFVSEPEESPFLDEFQQPTNPIEAVGAYIDRDNNRYGEVRGFIDQQDEINHRRSKFLHLLSSRQTYGRKGDSKDVLAMKRELSKPDGHVEFIGNKYGEDFGVLPTNDMAKGQIELYLDAKAELDAVSFNAQLAGDRQNGDLSGKAIDRLQQAGTIELNGLFTALNGWEKRIYRQVWCRVRQFWTEEKWIRVTDDQDNLRWVGLNGEITAQEWMEEIINDPSESLVKRKKIAASYTALMSAKAGQDLQAAQQAENVLSQVVGVKNPVAELDVDIILDQSFDTVNIQQEQFEMLAKFAQGTDIDIIELIELSQLRGKDALIEKIEKRRQEQSQMQGGALQLQAQEAEAKNRKTLAEAADKEQSAFQKGIENQILISNPVDTRPQVST